MVLLRLWVGGCSHGLDLHVLSVDGVEGLVSVDHSTEHHRLLGGWRCYGDPHSRSRKHRQNFVLLDISDVCELDDFVPLGAGTGALETQMTEETNETLLKTFYRDPSHRLEPET